MTRPFDNGSRQRHHFPEDNFQSCFSVFVLCNHDNMGSNSVWSRIGVMEKYKGFESEMLVIIVRPKTSSWKHKRDVHAVRLLYSFVYDITKVRWNEIFPPKNCQRRKVQNWNATSSKICRHCVHYTYPWASPALVSIMGVKFLGPSIKWRGGHLWRKVLKFADGEEGVKDLPIWKRTGYLKSEKKIPTSFMNGPIRNNTF